MLFFLAQVVFYFFGLIWWKRMLCMWGFEKLHAFNSQISRPKGSLCAIRLAKSSCSAPWYMADVAEEVIYLGSECSLLPCQEKH